MPNDKAITRDLIGTLVKSTEKSIAYEPLNYFLNFQKKLNYNNGLNMKVVNSVVYLKYQDKFIFSDKDGCSLKIVTNILGTNPLIQAFKDPHLEKPLQLCLGRNDQILVGDQNKIVVFDSNFTFLRIIKINLADDYKMKVDLTDHKSLLYISDINASEIAVILSHQNKIRNKICITRPEHMDFDENFLYVTSYPILHLNKKSKQVGSIQSKSNCIFVLNKFNYDVVRTIKSDNWLGPKGLFIDQFSNILTVVDHLYNDRKLIGNKYLWINNLKQEKNVQWFKVCENDCDINSYFISDTIFIICYNSHLNLYFLTKTQV